MEPLGNCFPKIGLTCEIISFRWSKRTGHNKAQILYYIAENLELRQSEIANRLKDEANVSLAEAEKQITIALQRLFHWAAYADKYGGNVQARN